MYLSCVHPADQIIQLPVNVSKVKKWVLAFSKFHHHDYPVDPLPLMGREKQNSPDLLSCHGPVKSGHTPAQP